MSFTVASVFSRVDAARAVGDAEELGPHGREIRHHGLQLLAADRGVGREELERDRNRRAHQ
jgi:hypothetical protein